MSADMLERTWQEQVTELAHVLGWRTMHVRRSIASHNKGWTTATSVKGWPDMCLWSEQQRRLIFVELKRETGRLTVEQTDVIRSLLAAGQEAYVFRPSDLERARDVLTGKAS